VKYVPGPMTGLEAKTQNKPGRLPGADQSDKAPFSNMAQTWPSFNGFSVASDQG